MRNTIWVIITLIALLSSSLILPSITFAQAPSTASSAQFALGSEANIRFDKRSIILQKFLEDQGSPMVGSAASFVKQADANNIDWKLLVAIAGLESGYGRAIPPGSYNAWGWGIYGNNTKYFTSYDDAIQVISKGLREQYMDSWGATDIYSIGRIYAASPTWATRVEHNLAMITAYETQSQIENLSLAH